MKEKTECNIKFGKRVTRLRQDLGISQEQLAFRCELNRTYIGAIERAEKSATVNTIYKIAKGLGVTPKTLFEE